MTQCNVALMFIIFYTYIMQILYVYSWPWQLTSVLPTDLVGAQIGIWNHHLHLINGVYNATKLNYSEDRNDLVLWLTTDLSKSISITSTESASFSMDPVTSWDNIIIASSSLGGFFCYSKCSAQIDQYLYVISPEKIDNNEPTGILIVYSLETKQLIAIKQAPFYLNGGTCVVHNDTHLFSLGGYNTQCPTHKFDERCDDPDHVLIYDTIAFQWLTGALLPDSARVDSAACATDNMQQYIYLFGGYNKHENILSNTVSKYYIATDQFALSVTTMRYARSEFSALLDSKKNLVYLIGGAMETVQNTAKIVEVYDINIDKIIDVTINALSKSIRWYGSTVYAYNDTIDLLLVVGGHTGSYYSSSSVQMKQNMTDYLQYLTINKNLDPYTDFPTYQPTTQPTMPPSWRPTKYPTQTPSNNPSSEPTIIPTILPTANPTIFPTKEPSVDPSQNPSTVPTFIPTYNPSTDPTWSPFTAPPSSTHDDDPYVIEIDIEIDCESESWITSIYSPTINHMIEELLTPKFERNPNIWVQTQLIITHSDEHQSCHIHIESIYSTQILSNAQQVHEYVNTTFAADLLNSFENTFDLTPDANDIHIIFTFATIQTQDPTSDPTSFPITTQGPETSGTEQIIIDIEETTSISLNKDTHNAFEEWLFAQNNLNWIVILVLCCLIFPCCIAAIWMCNRYQTQKLLRKHKKEIQKFTTLSSSMPSNALYTNYKAHKLTNQSESSDEDDDDRLPTHISPAAQGMMRTTHHGTQYLNIPNAISPDGYHGYYNIPMHMNTVQRMHMMHGLTDMNNIYGYSHYPFAASPQTHAYGIPLPRDASDDIDGKTTDEADGSTTADLFNRSRRDTLATVVSHTVNSNVVYNDSERMEYKDRDRENTYGEDDEIEAQSTITAHTQSLDTRTASNSNPNTKQYYSYSHAKREHEPQEDYMMVKGMGITPSLVALDSGSSKEDLTISIRKRNTSNATVNDDYKTSVTLLRRPNDEKMRNEAQDVDSSRLSPPYLAAQKKRNKSKLLKYRQSIALTELRAISPSPLDPNVVHEAPQTPPLPTIAMSDVPTLPPESDGDTSSLDESEHDKQYEDMYTEPMDGPTNTSAASANATQRPRSGTDASTDNTINSEEEQHEHTFVLK